MPDETVINDKAISDEEVLTQVRTLWKKYFVLTQELLKFISKNDVDTFFDIVDQRDQLIEKMKAMPENNFRETEECKELIEQIKPLDEQIMFKARAWLNKSRRQNAQVRTYGAIGPSAPFAGRGNIFNRQY